MSDIAIRVENLGKSYLVGHNAHQKERYTALRDVISRNIHNLVRKTSDMIHGRPIIQGDEVEEFWALRNVSFEVRQGDRIGIIGRNGAGKSTLLKILSRITEPSSGRVTINGRVASLLEVGTGFHPELTGRENIYLNGAILGMSRREIQRKFDEIVDFAEVEKFLDTPVKRYSSGMYVRLAFAVAAHLEPEILVVDEVLAVGDAQFQKKCLGKMENVASEGRTVLFVSHNMAAVEQLCTNSIILTGGKIECYSETAEVIRKYYNKVGGVNSIYTSNKLNSTSKIISLKITVDNELVVGAIKNTCAFAVEIEYFVNEWYVGSYICLDMFNESGERLIWSCDVNDHTGLSEKRSVGYHKLKVTIQNGFFAAGRYYFTVSIYNPMQNVVSDSVENAVSIDIVDHDSFVSKLGINPKSALVPPLNWVVENE